MKKGIKTAYIVTLGVVMYIMGTVVIGCGSTWNIEGNTINTEICNRDTTIVVKLKKGDKITTIETNDSIKTQIQSYTNYNPTE